MAIEQRHPTDRLSLERDCTVEAIRAGGPGGQHRNKSYTGVRLSHVPTGLVAQATERRSRERNLDAAFDRMAELLERVQHRPKPRIATKPTRGSRERRFQDKVHQGAKKANRRFKDE